MNLNTNSTDNDRVRITRNGILWGGPWWQRIIVGVLVIALAIGLTVFANHFFPRTANAIETRGNDDHPYRTVAASKDRFADGFYGNASGRNMPDWVFAEAKEYVRAHPWVAPGGVAPKACRAAIEDRAACAVKRGDWDWGWLEWTKDRLNTGRCLAIDINPLTWFGCGSQPDWVHTVRRVKVLCGGLLIIIALSTGNPIAAFGGGAGCAWSEFNAEFADGSWRTGPQ